MFDLNISATTYIGSTRSSNEDTVSVAGWMSHAETSPNLKLELYSHSPTLLLVADGMGGHTDGHIASLEVARYLNEQLNRLNLNTIKEVLKESHLRLHQLMTLSEQKMGTTLAGVVIHKNQAFIFNVGDSKAYLLRDKTLQQLSVDDTKNPATGKPSSKITQAIGGRRKRDSAVFEPHARVERIVHGDVILICSDGVSDKLGVGALEGILNKKEEPERTTDRLIHGAVNAESKDNLSAILAEIVDPSVVPRPANKAKKNDDEPGRAKSKSAVAKYARWILFIILNILVTLSLVYLF